MTVSRSSARQHLLDVASDLFYREGIRAIGVDTIVAQSGVGKATLYRHFATKDDLITAYLEEEGRRQLAWFEAVIAPYEDSPKGQLLALVDATAQRLRETRFRGCAFLNALAEFSEADHPAYRQAVESKRMVRSLLSQLSHRAGARDPEALADQFLLVINGALTSTPLFGKDSLAVQFTALAAHLIDHHLESPPAKS